MIDYGLFKLIYKPSKVVCILIEYIILYGDHLSRIPLNTYISFNGPLSDDKEGKIMWNIDFYYFSNRARLLWETLYVKTKTFFSFYSIILQHNFLFEYNLYEDLF